MNPEYNIYVCPETNERLKCIPDRQRDNDVISGRLVSQNGREYHIQDGIPDLTWPKALEGEQKEALDYYEGAAQVVVECGDLESTPD